MGPRKCSINHSLPSHVATLNPTQMAKHSNSLSCMHSWGASPVEKQLQWHPSSEWVQLCISSPCGQTLLSQGRAGELLSLRFLKGGARFGSSWDFSLSHKIWSLIPAHTLLRREGTKAMVRRPSFVRSARISAWSLRTASVCCSSSLLPGSSSIFLALCQPPFCLLLFHSTSSSMPSLLVG